MKDVNGDNLDRLISEMLDGELPEDDQLQLTREMLRNPVARRAHDQYAQIDHEAGDALRWLLDQPRHDHEVSTETYTRARRLDWSRWVASGWAVAAAMLLMAGLWVAVELNVTEHNTQAPMHSLSASGMNTGAATYSNQPVMIDMESAWNETAAVVQHTDYQEPRKLIETPTSRKRTSDVRRLWIIDEENDDIYDLQIQQQTSELQRIEEEL